MARKHEHEDHVNHEAWAIPYGDLITLLLAFFVVMYAVSSVNEGKYRVLSDSLLAAFRGQPHTFEPVSVGDKVVKVKQDDSVAAVKPKQAMKFGTGETHGRLGVEGSGAEKTPQEAGQGPGQGGAAEQLTAQLRQMTDDLESAMSVLIEQDMIRVHREASWVEVEIKTDILFPSGKAEIQPAATDVLTKLAQILASRPYPIRIEGHTDNRPIRTAQFPSNWELSAARAARIVRLFELNGISSSRLVVAGMGEVAPVADNATEDGRNRNRRVAIVILGAPPAADDPKPSAQADAEVGAEIPAPSAAPSVAAAVDPVATPEAVGTAAAVQEVP